MDAVLQNLRKIFGPSTPFFESLSLDPPKTMEELYRQADKYSMLEDNVRAATQTIMITSQPAEEISRLERSHPSLKKGKVENERDPVISHKKRESPAIYPPEHLV